MNGTSGWKYVFLDWVCVGVSVLNLAQGCYGRLRESS